MKGPRKNVRLILWKKNRSYRNRSNGKPSRDRLEFECTRYLERRGACAWCETWSAIGEPVWRWSGPVRSDRLGPWRVRIPWWWATLSSRCCSNSWCCCFCGCDCWCGCCCCCCGCFCYCCWWCCCCCCRCCCCCCRWCCCCGGGGGGAGAGGRGCSWSARCWRSAPAPGIGAASADGAASSSVDSVENETLRNDVTRRPVQRRRDETQLARSKLIRASELVTFARDSTSTRRQESRSWWKTSSHTLKSLFNECKTDARNPIMKEEETSNSRCDSGDAEAVQQKLEQTRVQLGWTRAK